MNWSDSVVSGVEVVLKVWCFVIGPEAVLIRLALFFLFFVVWNPGSDGMALTLVRGSASPLPSSLIPFLASTQL